MHQATPRLHYYDGDFVLYEAAAIWLYLADKHPEARLAPPVGTPARAHLYQWLIWCTNALQARRASLELRPRTRKEAAMWKIACVPLLALLIPFGAAAGNLVNADWLKQNLGRPDLVLLDASRSTAYAAGHIPGAHNVDLFVFGAAPVSPSAMERRFRSLGVARDRTIVVYDRGGDIMATRLFFDLYYHGLPPQNLFMLDGGLAKWQAVGGAVTKEPTPPPRATAFRVDSTKEEARVRLPEFLAASGDPVNHALVEALDANYHFGAAKFFDRAGHVPNGIMWSADDFFNEDKTFRSPQEIARMADYLGVRRDQTVHAYCGGGIAATVPFFALRFVAGYPKVKLYVESQLEWLQDDRGLPFWTYDAPYLLRDKGWLAGWGSRMMRMFGVTQLSVIDVRAPAAYAVNHVPFALNVPARVWKDHLSRADALAAVLGPAGVDAEHEAVIVSDGGLNPDAALAFVLLMRAGQRKVSILADSVDDWGFAGLPLTKDATVVAARKAPGDLAIPPTQYPARGRDGVIVARAADAQGAYPTVFVASGASIPDNAPPGRIVHVPYADLVERNGAPKAAKDIWKRLSDAGISRYAQIVVFAQDPGEAAVNYVVLKMMGFPDVKMLII